MKSLSNEGYGFGGLFGVNFDTPKLANTFMQRLQNKHGFGYMAVSLGYFDTLMSLSGLKGDAKVTARLTSGTLEIIYKQSCSKLLSNLHR